MRTSTARAAGLNPPNGVRIHVAGIDIVRDEEGTFRVLEDNLRNPSGVSYVMENRRTMARVFPDLFTRQRVRAVGDYSVHLLRALRAAAAPNVADPTVVVLTPGVYNSAYFEHSPTGPADGRRVGGGSGPVDTYRRWLPGEQDHVLAQLDELVLKPVEGSGGYGIMFGPNASTRQLASARRAIRDDPRGWIAQPVVQLSTVPTKVDEKLVPRHVDLRPFAVNDGEDVFVLPGGLTRVALPKGSLVVNSSQGGGSKDTWVLAATRAPDVDRELAATASRRASRARPPPSTARS